jgi:hypothetical protein
MAGPLATDTGAVLAKPPGNNISPTRKEGQNADDSIFHLLPNSWRQSGFRTTKS